MFSALKKLTKSGDDRCPAPAPMPSSLQKKFSRGVHYNMKILIKGDRNVGKSCLLQRLQGGAFIEEYAPTEQIQVAPIHWTYRNSDHIVKVEVWEVVDKGRTKKKPPLGLKLENETSPAQSEEGYETPVLDATFLDVYKNANGVILMYDITKPWTFDYVVKELAQVPADLPVIVLGNHCDMQHHRQVESHHIEQHLYQAKLIRTAPVRYAESSMRNGFGLRLLHKFLSVPFLRLQRTSLLEQLQRNQKDIEETEKELDEFQNSEESHYNLFVDRLASKRRVSAEQSVPRASSDRSPSIVLGAGKPIVPPNMNPLVSQSLAPLAQYQGPEPQVKQTQYVSPELLKPKHVVNMDMTPPRNPKLESAPSTPSVVNVSATGGVLDEFYAGALDSSFLDELSSAPSAAAAQAQHNNYESDSDDAETANPLVTAVQEELDIAYVPSNQYSSQDSRYRSNVANKSDASSARPMVTADRGDASSEGYSTLDPRYREPHSAFSESESFARSFESGASLQLGGREDSENNRLDGDDGSESEFKLWIGDSSARRSPEGGEDPDQPKEPNVDKNEKKHKKKKSKNKDQGEHSGDKPDRKDKRHKHKSRGEKSNGSNANMNLLADEYDAL